jgi:hypothetical protein
MITMNGYLVVTPYKNEGLTKGAVKSGMVTVKHAVSLIGLTLLEDYNDTKQSYLKGSVIYFKESDLGVVPWAKAIMKKGDVEFILARLENAVGVDAK